MDISCTISEIKSDICKVSHASIFAVLLGEFSSEFCNGDGAKKTRMLLLPDYQGCPARWAIALLETKPASVFAHYVRIIIVFAIGEINIFPIKNCDDYVHSSRHNAGSEQTERQTDRQNW